MDVIGLFHAMLARAVGRDVGHGTRPIERDQRDDVLEAVGPHVEQRAPHALAFQLEDAHRLGAREHGIGLFVIERDLRQIDLDPALAQERCRLF